MEKFRTTLLKLIFAVSIISLFYGCASHNTELMDTEDEVSFDIHTFSFEMSEHPFDILPMYKVSPGDILDVLFQIRTWEKQESFGLGIDNVIQIRFIDSPELNLEDKVRPDGTISLPYVGKYYVLGKDVGDLTNELTNKYKAILRNPQIYITVPEFRAAIKELKADLHTAPRGLSRLVTVRPDGYVTFPMVGDVMAAGKTFPELKVELDAKYDKLLLGLHVDLFLEQHAGAKLYVVGEVFKPGVYNISKPLTVEQVLAMAGSVTPAARLDHVIVARKNKDKMVARRLDLTNTFYQTKDYKFFYMKPDDILYIPKRPVTKMAELMRDIADVMMFRGWSVGLSFNKDLD